MKHWMDPGALVFVALGKVAGAIPLRQRMTSWMAAGAATVAMLVALPSQAQRLPDGFFPESLAAAADGTLYTGSAVAGSIVRVRPGSAVAEPFIAPGANGLMSAQGLFVDDANQRLYACTADLGLAPRLPKTESALLAFDLHSGAAAGRWPLPKGGFCNDIAQAPDSALLISDTSYPRILRFDPRTRTLSVWVEHPLLGGAAYNGNGIVVDRGSVYVSTFADGRLLRVPIGDDGRAGEPSQIKLPRPLAGADALRHFAPGVLVIFENDIAGGQGRVSRIDLTRVDPKLETLAEGLREPTSGVISAGRLIVIESQFRKLFGADKGAEPQPFALRTFKAVHP